MAMTHTFISKIYSQLSLSLYFTASKHFPTEDSSDIIWHKAVPLKISLIVWRLLHNRVPTSDNLLQRGLLQNQRQLWVGGCGSNEDIDHLFLHCNSFGTIWSLISHRIGYDTVNQTHISKHVLQFGHLGGISKHHCSTMNLLWLAFVWMIWNETNARQN